MFPPRLVRLIAVDLAWLLTSIRVVLLEVFSSTMLCLRHLSCLAVRLLSLVVQLNGLPVLTDWSLSLLHAVLILRSALVRLSARTIFGGTALV